MKNYFLRIKEVLRQSKPQDKFELFYKLYDEYKQDKLSFDKTDTIEVFKEPSFAPICNIVPPAKVPKRKNLQTKEGMAILLHAIAHIEYSAIDLALDACYRFQDMPREFYDDWMEVAEDEIRHFIMIDDAMKEYDVSYGDYNVHQGLFDASMKTLDLIPRMALIPRYMEANGLDSNQALIEKLNNIPNTQKIIDMLYIILDEEISHVQKGDRWYKYGCSQKENFTCDYFKIVNSVYPNSFKQNKALNIKARQKAGFSDDEIEKLKNFK